MIIDSTLILSLADVIYSWHFRSSVKSQAHKNLVCQKKRALSEKIIESKQLYGIKIVTNNTV